MRFEEPSKPEPIVNKEYAASIPEEQPKELDRKRTIVAKKSGGIELEE